MAKVTRECKLIIGLTSVAFLIWFYPTYETQPNTQTSRPTRTTGDHVPRGPIHVLLFSYMSGGSRFAAEMFDFNKDAIYWYEPLAAVHVAIKGKLNWQLPLRILTDKNGDLRDSKDTLLTTMATQLSNILQCNLVNVTPEVFAHHSTSIMNSKLEFRNCLKNQVRTINHKKLRLDQDCGNLGNNNTDFSNNPLNWKDLTGPGNRGKVIENIRYSTCIKRNAILTKDCTFINLTNTCKGKQVRVAKVLRVLFSQIEDLNKKVPNLKVIYLLRDPRGIVRSRQKAGLLLDVKAPLEDEAIPLCMKMKHDLLASFNIDKTLPGVSLTVKYEDLAANPTETIKRIYEHLGLEVPSNVLNRYSQLTRSKVDIPNLQIRANSTATAYAWKSNMASNDITVITKLCKEVLELGGYV